jgi:hypothetical protein
VKIPDGKVFEPLKRETQIPVGSIIDATNGVVTEISAVDGSGRDQSVSWSEGRFIATQEGAALSSVGAMLAAAKKKKPKKAPVGPTTIATMTGPLSNCVNAKSPGGRSLLGDGLGRHRIVGERSSATTSGARWRVQDLCNGKTRTVVLRGKVSVRDFKRKRTVVLKKGGKYVAPGAAFYKRGKGRPRPFFGCGGVYDCD